MRHAWPFGARSDDSRRKCAANDQPRLLTDVVGALVDRAPIDWRALLTRVHTREGAGLIETLRAVEAIRSRSRETTKLQGHHPIATGIARTLAAVAAIQTALGLVILLASPWTPTAPGIRPTQIALALAFFAAGALLATTTTRDPRHTFLLATFLCIASTFVRVPLLKLPPDTTIDLLTAADLKLFIPACVWQFALDFPRVPRFTRFDVWGRRVTAGAWAFGGVAVMLSGARLYELELSLFWRAFSVLVLPAVCAILIRSRRAPYPERVKVARLALALVAGGLPFLVQGFVRTLAPRFNTWLVTAPGHERFWLDLVVIGGLMASPLLSTAAVIVDRPFELRAAWWRISRARSLSARRLARAVERITAACGPRETTFILDRELRSEIGASRTRVMTPHTEGSFTDRSGVLTPIAAGTALHAIVGEGTIIDLTRGGPLFELLPAVDRKWVIANDIELMAPLRGRTGDIAAIVAIGPQRGGQPYAADDRTLVTALAAAAGLAWDADRSAHQLSLAQPAYECHRCGLLYDAEADACACAGDLMLAPLPRTLNAKFIVERRIGRGGTGVVYVARDMTIGRDVALKTLPTLRRGIGTRLADEARTMASLRHEGLATIYGLEVWRQMPILVMEYFPRGTLARRLSSGPLSASDTIQLGITLADTLSYLHDRGLLHRDLKPSNIALSSAGEPVLLDFGIATWLEPPSPPLGPAPAMDSSAIVGTPAYLPPEAFQGAPASPGFDLWALSVILLECVMRDEAPGLAAMLERGLDRDVAKRFQTAADLRHALATVR